MFKLNLKLTDRDIDILKLLYYSKALAKKHIISVFYSLAKSGHNRLEQLYNAGYLDRGPYMVPIPGYKRKKRKKYAYYYLGKIGFDYLKREGCISQNERYNEYIPGRSDLDYYMDISELFNLLAKDYEWNAARLTRQRYKMSNTIPLTSTLGNINAPDHVIYKFKPENEYVSEKKLASMHKKKTIAVQMASKQFKKAQKILLYTESNFKNIINNYPSSGEPLYLIKSDRYCQLKNLISNKNYYLDRLADDIENRIPNSKVDRKLELFSYKATINGQEIELLEYITRNTFVKTIIKNYEGPAPLALLLEYKKQIRELCPPEGVPLIIFNFQNPGEYQIRVRKGDKYLQGRLECLDEL